MNTKTREDALTREILEAIDDQSNVTQRHLANRLGVALGLANSYLKRCVRKGLIKIEQAPANRYLYYLTPRGFAEKSRLTADYLSVSFDFYRRASTSCNEIFQLCEKEKFKTVLLCGVSELAEIAVLRAREHRIALSGFYDGNCRDEAFLGLPVWRSLDEAGRSDAYMITGINNPTEILARVEKKVDYSRIFIPDLLGIRKEDSNGK